jgi:hypothetical protein
MANQLKNLMGAGQSALSANSISGYSSVALTATGSTQATALLLSSDVNEVTTTASSTGVLLPANAAPGDELVIANFGAQTLSVYPSGTTDTINALSAQTAFSVASGKTCYFVKVSSTRWASILTA